MRIAKPLLAITTPVGVVGGLVEAWRIGPWLAALMSLLVAVIGGFVWMTWRRIRQEARDAAHSERVREPRR